MLFPYDYQFIDVRKRVVKLLKTLSSYSYIKNIMIAVNTAHGIYGNSILPLKISVYISTQQSALPEPASVDISHIPVFASEKTQILPLLYFFMI